MSLSGDFCMEFNSIEESKNHIEIQVAFMVLYININKKR